MRVPKFEKIVDEFCRFQETIDLLTVVCIDKQGLVCEPFGGGCKAMTNRFSSIIHNFRILPVSAPHC